MYIFVNNNDIIIPFVIEGTCYMQQTNIIHIVVFIVKVLFYIKYLAIHAGSISRLLYGLCVCMSENRRDYKNLS